MDRRRSVIPKEDDVVELNDSQMASIKDAFRNADINHNGHIPKAKLADLMRTLGHDLKQHELRDLMEHVDTDGSGTIEWDEFLPLMAAMVKEKEEQAFYKQLFKMLDKKNKGYISCSALRDILHGMAEQVDLTEDEIDHMIQETDEDQNGEVSFEEFYKLMTTE